MLQIKSFTFNPFQENTYLLYDETGEAVIFDPGCYEKHEQQELDAFIAEEELKIKYLINTHCHIDHVLGNFHVKKTYKVPLLLHSNELATLKSVPVYAPNYGFRKYDETEPDGFLEGGTSISFGNQTLDILFVPGHSPGHLVFYHKETNSCIAGDTLFQGSIGRTDLPGGNHHDLLKNIREVMFKLPDTTRVYPGHGPSTSIGFEKSNNPFVGERARF